MTPHAANREVDAAETPSKVRGLVSKLLALIFAAVALGTVGTVYSLNEAREPVMLGPYTVVGDACSSYIKVAVDREFLRIRQTDTRPKPSRFEFGSIAIFKHLGWTSAKTQGAPINP